MNPLPVMSAEIFSGPLMLLGSVLVYGACFVTPATVFVIVAHKLLSTPLRRRDRARLFLDLMETAFLEGRPVEETLISASATRDASPGVHFHLLAAHLENGLRLGDALTKVPQFLPPQISAMLKAGERIGDVSKVLPACRQLLNDGISQTRGAINYLLILAFVITPFTISIPLMLKVIVLPRFKEIFAGMMAGLQFPAFSTFVFANSGALLVIQCAMLVLVWTAMIAYVGGPRFTALARSILPGVPDWIFHSLPWRRKRLQRDFSTILSVLLDSGVPEIDAVALAAETTSNSVMRRHAAVVCAQLGNGVRLPEAIRAMDRSGELQWRLANSFQHGRDFVRTLAGWHEALDAKAFQLEQAAAQITTTALVLFNGLIVGGVVAAIFLALTHLMMEAALW